MVIIPYNTDAPIYHWPIMTLGLIATNISLYVGVELGYCGTVDDWLLRFGQGLHPVQWLACNFMHLGIGHLLGNMLFLWVFGLITEGKLGWWRFLLCYLGIGVVFAAVEQTLLLSYDGPVTGAAGASAAIFGLIGMALIWAPKNDVHCYFGYWMHIVRVGTFDLSVTAVAGIYFGINLLFLLIHQQLASSEAAHLLGGACGLAIGVVLLQTRIVDCEGWDIFSVWRGEAGSTKRVEIAAAKFDELAEQDQQHKVEQAPKLIAFFVEQGNFAMAYQTYAELRDADHALAVEPKALLAMVKYLVKKGAHAEAIPLLEELVARSPHSNPRLQLKLAELYLRQRRPIKAEKILCAPCLRFPPELELVRKRLLARAQRLQQAGVLELAD